MNVKFTVDTIKDLKIKVKEMNGTLLSYYTKDGFKPDDSFRLFTEQCEVLGTDGNWVNQMISAFEQTKLNSKRGNYYLKTLNLILNKHLILDFGHTIITTHFINTSPKDGEMYGTK